MNFEPTVFVIDDDPAVRNAMRLAGTTLPQAVRMASANPARALGLEDKLGSIAVGRSADLVLLDDKVDVIQTWVAGESVYRKGEA